MILLLIQTLKEGEINKLYVYFFLFLRWGEYSKEHYPGEHGFSNEAKDYVNSFTIEVILPLTNTLVLQYHVYREGVEENEVE